MNAEHALQLWKNSRSEGLPSADCTVVDVERLLHLELQQGAEAHSADPTLRLMVHAVLAAHGFSALRPGKRRAPSAGARYPVECLALRWHQGAPRLWMVSVNGGSVVRMSDAYAAQVVRSIGALPGDDHVVVVASLWKTIERYGLAGVRYTVYDAGHVLSNLTEFAVDEGERLGLGLDLEARSVFRELPNNLVALYAVRLRQAMPLLPEQLSGLHWPGTARQGTAVHIDPPSFSPLLARARRLFALMARQLGGRVLPACSLTRQRRRGVDWVEARRSVKGFSPRPLANPRSLDELQGFLGELFRRAREVYGVELGMAHFRRDAQGGYALEAAESLRDDHAVAASQTSEAFVQACNGQAQVNHAEAISVMFVQLSHLPPDERLAATAAAQNCVGLLSAEIYRHCSLSGVGTTMLCGFSSQKLVELMAGNADWPLALHLFGQDDPAGLKSDIRYFM